MHKLGTILAFIFNKIFIFVLLLLFFTGLPLVGVASTFTSSQSIKDILSESSVYTTVPDNILDIIELEDEKTTENELQQQQLTQPGQQTAPSDNEQALQSEKRTIRAVLEENGVIDPDELVATIKATLDPEFLEGQVAGVLDGVYRFLDGDSNTLNFELSLKDRSDVAAKELKQFVTNSLSDLPTCTQDQVKVDEEIEILDINCLPPGSNIGTEINKFIDELTADDGVFGEVYTQEDLDISEVDLEGAQVAYRVLDGYASFLWMVIIGISFAVILTAKTTHRGFKEVGVIYAVVGLLFLVGFSALAKSADLNDLFVSSSGEFTPGQEQAIRNIVEPVAENLVKEISSHMTIASMSMLIVGLACFAFGIVLSKHHVEHLQIHHQPDDGDTARHTAGVDTKLDEGNTTNNITASKTQTTNPTKVSQTAGKARPVKKPPKKIQ